MALEQLQALAADVDRLLTAGANSAAGDEGLRRRSRSLRDGSKQVPVLGQIADAVDRVTAAKTSEAARTLLDLLLVVRQVRASTANAGLTGTLKPIEVAGPWATTVSGRDLYLLLDALCRAGGERVTVLKDALERGQIADLRLLGPLFDCLDDNNAELANLVAEKALPAFGAAVLPELQRDLNLKGTRVDARRLWAICELDRSVGATLCRKALIEGSPAVRLTALESFPQVAPEEAEQAALSLLSQDPGRELRAAALAALASSRADAALDALAAAVTQSAEVWNAAHSALKKLPHPKTSTRLLQELQGVAGELESAKKNKTSKKDEAARSRQLERASRLAEVLGARGDRKVAPDLVELLQHPLTEVREALMGAIIELGDEASLKAVAEFLDDPKLGELAARAAWKLPAAPRFERLSPWCDALSHPKKPQRKRAELLLSLFEQEATAEQPRTDWDSRWSEVLREHLNGPNRSGVAIALEVVLGKKAVPLLLKELEPSVKKDECGVVEALGRLRVREAVPTMMELLPSQKAHHYCIHDALRLIGDVAVLPQLREMHEKTRDYSRRWHLERVIRDLERAEGAN